MNNIYDFFLSLNLQNSMSFSSNLIILNISACFLIMTIIKIIYTEDILTLIALASLNSILLVVIYLSMDSPDVAMTEASVNVCLATVISIGAIKTVKKFNQEQDSLSSNTILSVLICCVIIACFIYVSLEFKEFGAPWAQIHNQIGKFYIENTSEEIGISSIVCAVLASYRGFDTMCETAVIATSVIVVLLILSTEYQSEQDRNSDV